MANKNHRNSCDPKIRYNQENFKVNGAVFKLRCIKRLFIRLDSDSHAYLILGINDEITEKTGYFLK